MDYFPSSWIIGPDSAAGTADSLTAPPPPIQLPSPRPAPEPSTQPPDTKLPPHLPPPPIPAQGKRVPVQQRHCDHHIEATLPFRLRRRRSSIFSLCGDTGDRCCCCDDVFPDHLRPPGSTYSKPPPQQSPFGNPSSPAGPYPTHFPPTWLLGALNNGINEPSWPQKHSQHCPHAAGTPHRPPSRSVETPKHIEQQRGEGQRLHSTLDQEDVIMRDLKGPSSRQEEIDRWMQSQQQQNPGHSTDLWHGTGSGLLWWAQEKHPSEVSVDWDNSGLGDAPHKGLEVPDTYSVYKMPAYGRV
ncbi:hypothetical protein QBC40DRAFT_284631 [Triangularia verruculosa]|uniref:Uncharacterized protein n=1 Tax=Triangularia verruculosa TaxID=2587418 RepID=A0AAN6XE70_9PEZI|nr:hypothetical protein QBC40DRAFT_284631 [Triangularia verruculosa]